MRVNDKGQVTIPQAVREKLGIRPGDEVVFAVRDDEVVMRPALGAGRLLVERLANSATSPDFTSTHEVMRLIARD